MSARGWAYNWNIGCLQRFDHTILAVFAAASIGCGLVVDYDFQPGDPAAITSGGTGASPGGGAAAVGGERGDGAGGAPTAASGAAQGGGGAAASGGDGSGGGGGKSASTASSTAASSGSGTSCGNGTLEAGEECDDGNILVGDGCDACVVVCNDRETKGPMPFHCYRVDYGGKPWSSARSQCLTWGGDLAAIGSDAEQAFVSGLIGSTSWIGGSDMNRDGFWQWSNGEPWSYAHWDLNEPNNNGGDERCLEMRNSGYWNDRPCDTVYAAVCERFPTGS